MAELRRRHGRPGGIAACRSAADRYAKHTCRSTGAAGVQGPTQDGHAPVAVARPKADAHAVDPNPSDSNTAGQFGDPLQRDTFPLGFAIVNG